MDGRQRGPKAERGGGGQRRPLPVGRRLEGGGGRRRSAGALLGGGARLQLGGRESRSAVPALGHHSRVRAARDGLPVAWRSSSATSAARPRKRLGASSTRCWSRGFSPSSGPPGFRTNRGRS